MITNRDSETGHNDSWCNCLYGDCLCACEDCQEESLRQLMEEAPIYKEAKKPTPIPKTDWYARTVTHRVISEKGLNYVKRFQ